MTKPPPVTVLVLLAVDVVFLFAMFVAFHYSYPPEVKTTMLTVFSGWNGALALALKAGDQPPNPPAG